MISDEPKQQAAAKLTSCESTYGYGYGMHAWPALFAFLNPPS
jgi:hypothetical protein